VKSLKIYGPPGTGKTRKMLELFEKELTRTSPDRVAFMTFTRAARLEALQRSGRPEEELPWVKTIHAICYKVLKIRQNQLVTGVDLRRFGQQLGVEIRGTLHDPWSLESLTGRNSEPTIGDRLLQLNHLGRHQLWGLRETLRHAPTDLDWHFAKFFTEAYRGWKKSNNLLDYTDLLIRYLEHGNPLDVDVVFIDEAQDLSKLQWQVARKLGMGAYRRYLAGDDDQAIFTWAGASPDAFNEEPTEEVTVLDQSYRLPRNVQNISEKIVKRIQTRHHKQFSPRDAQGDVQDVGLLSQEHLGDSSTFILFRNHYRGEALAAQLKQLYWPFSGAGSPLEDSDIKELLSAYRDITRGHDVSPSGAKSIVLYAHMQYLKGHAESTAASSERPIPVRHLFNCDPLEHKFESVFSRLRYASYLGPMIRACGIDQVLNPSVTLMSIHQSKGRQAGTVILDLEMSRRTFEGLLNNPDDEHRVWYVGVTRAQNRLITLLPTDSSFYKI
jgi:superfamily I DNA/RNA helicase